MIRTSIRNMTIFLLATVVTSIIGVVAHGDIIVEDNGPLDNRYTWDIIFSGGKYTITILPDCYDFISQKPVLCNGGTIEITSTTNNDIIALLDYQADGFLQPAIQVKASISGNKIAAIDEIRDTTANIGAFVTADVTGDIGSVDVDTMWQWTVGGNLTGLIVTKRIHNLIVGGDITGPISVQNLIELISVNGNIFNRIETTNGAITAINVLGNIGAPGSPVDINFDSGQNGDGMHRIKAANIYANIDATAGTNGGGPFGHLETRTGDFVGSLHVNELISNSGNADIIIAGNLNADITVDNQVETLISTGGDFTKTMTIGGVLTGDMTKGIAIGGDLTPSASIAINGDIDAPITVAGDILDNVTTPSISTTGSLFNDGTNSFGSIDVLGTKPGSNGDLSGEILINGDMAGPIHLAGNLIATLTPMASINIDGSIKADAASGMEGQILIDGNMLGDITIGVDVEGLIADDATRNIDIT